MSKPTKIDYSKLLGFDIVADELNEGVDLKNPTVAAKLGAKAGPPPPPPTTVKVEEPMLMTEVSGPGSAFMRGLGGRKVDTN
jgi:hypothetical protein